MNLVKDVIQCAVVCDDFQKWLESGTAPLTLRRGENAAVMFTRLERSPDISYLYSVPVDQDNRVSWHNSLEFSGVYDSLHGALYLTDSASYNIMKRQPPIAEKVVPSMAEEIRSRVDRRVEEIIANDRSNLSVRNITGAFELRNLQYFQEHGARESVIRQFFSDGVPDTRFHSDYQLKELPEAAFMAYIQDPEGFVQSEARQHIEANEEKFLLQFLENDALLSEYQALMQDTSNPIHRMKAITDAVKASGAKTVTVTVQKDGTELTFKTEASSLIGYRNRYSTFDIPAQDRREFEQLFGRYADYTAEDITRITYGRNTIYEAPPVQTEELAEGCTAFS